MRKKIDGKLWTATGLKYLWAVLQEHTLVNLDFLAQAETAGVALSRIGDFITALKNEAWLAKGKDGWILERQKGLENKWTELYPRVLKPNLFIGNFRFTQAILDKMPEEWYGVVKQPEKSIQIICTLKLLPYIPGHTGK